jgi:hypothetical protein
MEDRIEELEQKLDSCKQFVEYLLKQTKDAENKTQHELWNVVSELEYEAGKLLVEEF